MGKILYQARLILVVICVILAGILGFTWCLFRPFHPNNSRQIGRVLSKAVLFIMGLRLEVEGLENYPEKGPFIIVSNHQHNIDIFINSFVMPPRTVSLGKKSIAYIPFFGQMYWLAGNLLIDRKNKEKAKATMTNALEDMNKNRKNLWILAEGTRSITRNQMGPFKLGAFRLAHAGEMLVVPVAISNIQGSINFTKWRAGTVKAEILKPVNSTNYAEDQIPKFASCVRQMILDRVVKAY